MWTYHELDRMSERSLSRTLTRFVPRALRSLEASGHSVWLRGLVRGFAPRGGPLPDWDAQPRRILFIRYDRVGDMVLSTGILRAIAAAHPRFSIDVLTTPANADVLAHVPFVDELILHERRRKRDYPRLIGRLRARRYDAVIDGLVIRPSVNSYTTLLMLASRAPSAAQACRRWPDESFAAMLLELRARARDARVIIVALEQDMASAARLAASVRGGAIIPTLRELFALVATSDLVVTPDTGVTHIAAAFERPTLALMRRREEYEPWVPYRTPGVNVFGPTEALLSDLPVARVVRALDSALAIAGIGERRQAV